jgi:hypothetical protein
MSSADSKKDVRGNFANLQMGLSSGNSSYGILSFTANVKNQ